MDLPPQGEISPQPCGPNMQPGSRALVGASPPLPPRFAVQELPLTSPSDAFRKQSGLSPVQAPSKVTDQMQLGQARSSSTPATLASISRPRPTALGTKAVTKPTRISVESSKEIDLASVCIPGPQSANVLPHAQSESSFPLHSPQSPHSPQSYLKTSPSLPLPKPSPKLPSSLSLKPSLSPEPQRTPSPGSSTQSQAKSERPGEENKDFR